MEGEQVIPQSQTQFQAHSGPCWQVAWAHPKFENVIATCGYDKNIKIWKEVRQNQWEVAFKYEAESSVNCLQWSSWEHGLVLVAGCADGVVHHISRSQNDEWTDKHFTAHDSSINGICWGPATEPCLLKAENNDLMNPSLNDKALAIAPQRFVTGSMDG